MCYLKYFIIIDQYRSHVGSWEDFSRVAAKGLQNYGEFGNLRVFRWSYVNTGISPLYYCIDKVFLET